MKIVIPLKAPARAKKRLSSLLDPEQRANFCCLMLQDVLNSIQFAGFEGETIVVCSEPTIREITESYGVQLIVTPMDGGYCEDALIGIEYFSSRGNEAISIIPADVPLLAPADVTELKEKHASGITLCPAMSDGGTNALVFDPPLGFPLQFGLNSLNNFRKIAARNGLASQVLEIGGLARDIDTCEDLRWLKSCAEGGAAWSYLQDIPLAAG